LRTDEEPKHYPSISFGANQNLNDNGTGKMALLEGERGKKKKKNTKQYTTKTTGILF